MAGPAAPDDERGAGSALDDLLVRSGTGDAGAFAALYDRLAPRVFGLVTRLVRDADAAEQISCDAFLEAWRRAPGYDPAQAGAVAWVLAIVRRIAVPASRLVPRTGEPSTAGRAPDAFLVSSGLTRAQADAVHLAWYDGRDHRWIEAELRPDEPVATTLTVALRAMAPVGPR